MRLRVLLVVVPLLIAPPRTGAQEPFRVNTYTPGEQANPALAGQGDGGFVVVWESLDQDGDYIGVFGQRFAGDGARRGSEFQVNQYVFGPQALPDVAAMPSGGFVVVWQGYGDGGDYADIFARRYASNGAALGGEFQVNVPVSAYSIELAAAVAATADDGFTVVWDDFDDVHARRYDSAGAPRDGSFLVNATTLGTQATAAVAGLADGGFVVAWADGYYLDDGQDGYGYGVFGRRFTSAGNAAGTDFLISTSTLGDQYGPALAATPDGGFVVAWQSYGHRGAESAIFARRYDSNGAAVGGELPVGGSGTDEAGPPSVGADQAGFLVSWTSKPRGGDASSVLVRRFSSGGIPASAAEAVDPGADDQHQPAATGLAEGGYVVVWSDAAGDGDSPGIRGRSGDFSTPAATPTGTPPAMITATGTATSSIAAATPTTSPTAATPPPPTATTSPTLTGLVVTATATSTVAPPTATSTLPPPTTPPSPTATAAATATVTPRPCAGDCNRDGAVSVDELVLAVNVALGSQPAGRCQAADGDGDQQVTVAELIAAVNRALGGCALRDRPV